MKALEFFLTKDLHKPELEFRTSKPLDISVHLLCAVSPNVNKTGNTQSIKVSITEV